MEILLRSLVDEVRSIKRSQSSLESRLAVLGVLPPSSMGSDLRFNTSAETQTSNQQSSKPSISPPTSLLSEVAQTNRPVTTNTSKLPRRSSQFEDEGSTREKLRFSDWMRAEEAAESLELDNIIESGKTKTGYAHIYPQRVILTTYPGQTGIKPIHLDWGNHDPQARGPVVASRHPHSLKIRNAIGAYSGSYCIYKALATAIGAIDPNHRPDYTNTEPPFNVSPNPSWSDASKIVSMDPWGHLTTQIFKSYFDSGVDIRPTVACTKAHLKLAELDEAVAEGRLLIDGKIVVKSPGSWASAAAETSYKATGGDWDSLTEDERHLLTSKKAGVEVPVTKAAVEPVWNLPGVASRFGIAEGVLRRALFEDTGGMYPELLTRNDLKTYLPPIGGLTVYIFGDPEFVSDPSKELTLRVHDECNGSDVFGSSICTCRPYLLYGIEEAIKCAQRGGSGVVVYFRKEGRALGEVTKYLVYNARKRGGDSAALYFQRTETIAGVKDMRFQALMPDVLHWLGIKKIDVMCSMSDMKHDAIVQSGIPILVRKDIPDHLIPSDSKVEIDAKIAAGYFSASKVVTEEDLKNTIGRGWEDVDH
ncbi:GTP cyclohydrolase II [Phakopsora pachyrhizi]|nr:GTP cyclohydrolase II [Phakopsora pachyrhizi]